MFGGYFLYNGINHFIHREQLSGYAQAKGVPKPDWAVITSGAMLIIGGTSLMLGIKPKYGALAIVGFLAGVSPTMHRFWSEEDANQRMNDMINFSKNLALVGGAVALMSVEEPWPASVPIAQPDTAARVRSFLQEKVAA
jgi:uncharacterized membrane protein YphA (DoxX/SURF4 family)